MSATDPVEHVLVTKTVIFHKIGHFQGFSSEVDKYLLPLTDSAATWYMPRPEMEKNPDYKQLIPYCVFKCGDLVFSYERGTGQGEARLHSKKSVGVGGHISTLDMNRRLAPYLEGMHREIYEEVKIDVSGTDNLCIGLINDDENEVGKVHLGIVHLFELEKPEIEPQEKSMLNAGFHPFRDLINKIEEFETWSQICLTALVDRMMSSELI